MPHEHICEYCGKEYEAIHKIRRFCSKDCWVLGRGPPWNKGKKMSPEFCKKISKANFERFKKPSERLKISLSHRRGDHIEGYKKQSKTLSDRYASGEIKPWNKGLTKDDDPRIMLSNTPESKRKKAESCRKKWQDPEYRHKVISRSLKALFGNRPTSLEKQFIQLIDEYNLPFKYVGDGELIIASCNPDFVSIDNRNLLIEVANRVHHSDNYSLQRYAIFKKYGYRTCTIWQESFEGSDWKEKILKILVEKRFIELSVAVCRASLR